MSLNSCKGTGVKLSWNFTRHEVQNLCNKQKFYSLLSHEKNLWGDILDLIAEL